uniref:DUF7733 domain-containing protein n=1 Tax=Ananas comosus var. bracteatus TaxID=296719 RepID=A0A6V7NNL5_ANACO|nr:unnamed protein product [Ananas comosus var. bracteatus]
MNARVNGPNLSIQPNPAQVDRNNVGPVTGGGPAVASGTACSCGVVGAGEKATAAAAAAAGGDGRRDGVAAGDRAAAGGVHHGVLGERAGAAHRPPVPGLGDAVRGRAVAAGVPGAPGAGSAESAGDEEIFRGRGWFRGYVVVGTTVGLFLPLAYVLGGFARGDDHAVRSATPHLFLLSCQILTENVVGGLGIFSPPVRALVPMLYTVRRVFVVIDWVHDVWINKALPATATATANLQDVGWMWFGRSLAVANLVYFSVNLLVFLIPQFLPRAFEMYFKQRDGAETVAKAAEDKQAAKDNVRASTEDAGRTGKDHAPRASPTTPRKQSKRWS